MNIKDFIAGQWKSGYQYSEVPIKIVKAECTIALIITLFYKAKPEDFALRYSLFSKELHYIFARS